MKFSGKADLLWVSSDSPSIVHGSLLNIVEVAAKVWLLDLPLGRAERQRRFRRDFDIPLYNAWSPQHPEMKIWK